MQLFGSYNKVYTAPRSRLSPNCILSRHITPADTSHVYSMRIYTSFASIGCRNQQGIQKLFADGLVCSNRILVNWTSMRLDEVARRFEGALVRRAVSQIVGRCRPPGPIWSRHIMFRILSLREFTGAGFGGAQDVLVELYDALPTATSNGLWEAV